MKPVGNKSVVASDSESAGPFIFSSLRGKVKQSKKGKSEPSCVWCCYIVDVVVVIVAVVVVIVAVVVIVVDVVTGVGVGTGGIVVVVGVVTMLIL